MMAFARMTDGCAARARLGRQGAGGRFDAVAATPGFTIHATKKLLHRVKQPVSSALQPASVLGNWYATALFWKPQVALLVNEATLLPLVGLGSIVVFATIVVQAVFVPLAPAGQLAGRFPDELRSVLDAHGLDPGSSTRRSVPWARATSRRWPVAASSV